MLLKDFLNRIFRKNSSISSIALLSDIVSILKRRDIKDEESLHKLDCYKNDYLSLLSKNRTTLSKHLETSVQDRANMYTELLLKAMGVNPLRELYQNKETEEEMHIALEKKVSICKMRYYYTSIELLERETMLRLVALSEILEEKKFLLPSKKNAILETINQLSSSFLMVQSQKRAIQVETEAYLKEYQENKEENLETAIRKKSNSLYNMINSVLLTHHERRQSLFGIVSMEVELESYLYQNREDLLQKKANLFSRLYDVTELYDSNNELFLKAMALYGIKLVNQDDLALFYHKKFPIWKREFLARRDGTPESFIEKYFYKKILEDKIESLLMGRIGAYQGILEPSLIARVVESYFKDKNGKFSVEDMFCERGRTKLEFLFAFDAKGLLDLVFDQTYPCNSETALVRANIYFRSSFLRVDNKLSTKTFFLLSYLSGKTNLPLISDDGIEKLYPLFVALQKEDTSSSFMFPPEIQSINTEIQKKSKYHLLSDEKKFILNMRKMVNMKSLILRPSFLEIAGDIFDGLNFQSISFALHNQKITSAFQNIKAEEVHVRYSYHLAIENCFQNAKIERLYVHFFDPFHYDISDFTKLILPFFELDFSPLLYSNQIGVVPIFQELILGDDDRSGITLAKEELIFYVSNGEEAEKKKKEDLVANIITKLIPKKLLEKEEVEKKAKVYVKM